MMTQPLLEYGATAVFSSGVQMPYNTSIEGAMIRIAGAVWRGDGWWYYDQFDTTKQYPEYNIVTFPA